MNVVARLHAAPAVLDRPVECELLRRGGVALDVRDPRVAIPRAALVVAAVGDVRPGVAPALLLDELESLGRQRPGRSVQGVQVVLPALHAEDIERVALPVGDLHEHQRPLVLARRRVHCPAVNPHGPEVVELAVVFREAHPVGRLRLLVHEHGVVADGVVGHKHPVRPTGGELRVAVVGHHAQALVDEVPVESVQVAVPAVAPVVAPQPRPRLAPAELDGGQPIPSHVVPADPRVARVLRLLGQLRDLALDLHRIRAEDVPTEPLGPAVIGVVGRQPELRVLEVLVPAHDELRLAVDLAHTAARARIADVRGRVVEQRDAPAGRERRLELREVAVDVVPGVLAVVGQQVGDLPDVHAPTERVPRRGFGPHAVAVNAADDHGRDVFPLGLEEVVQPLLRVRVGVQSDGAPGQRRLVHALIAVAVALVDGLGALAQDAIIEVLHEQLPRALGALERELLRLLGQEGIQLGVVLRPRQHPVHRAGQVRHRPRLPDAPLDLALPAAAVGMVVPQLRVRRPVVVGVHIGDAVEHHQRLVRVLLVAGVQIRTAQGVRRVNELVPVLPDVIRDEEIAVAVLVEPPVAVVHAVLV